MIEAPAAAAPGGGRRGRTASLAGVVTFAVIAFCILAVDRPAASWTHMMFGAAGPEAALLPFFIGLTHIVDPLVPLAAIGFVVLGVWLVGANAPPRHLRPLFAACAATLVAIAVKDQLKYAFGRLWPETWVNGNPSWIANGAFGFSPFHGGVGWSSFPSGHMTLVTTPMAIWMLARPAWRQVAALPILLVALGLYGADYHFVSDMLAGVLLGAACAVIVWRVVVPPAGAASGGGPPQP